MRLLSFISLFFNIAFLTKQLYINNNNVHYYDFFKNISITADPDWTEGID